MRIKTQGCKTKTALSFGSEISINSDIQAHYYKHTINLKFDNNL